MKVVNSEEKNEYNISQKDLINLKKLLKDAQPGNFKISSYVRETIRNFIGETNLLKKDSLEKIIDGVLSELRTKDFLEDYRDLKVFQDKTEPSVYNISFNMPMSMPMPMSEMFDNMSWVTVKEGWHICLNNIPNSKSLSQALLEYLSTIVVEPWDGNKPFILLKCNNCNCNTLYNSLQNIPQALDNSGQLYCPHCNYAWLTYSYED